MLDSDAKPVPSFLLGRIPYIKSLPNDYVKGHRESTSISLLFRPFLFLGSCTMPFGRVLAVALLCHGVIAGPGPAPDETLAARSAPRKLHGRFLHITGEYCVPLLSPLGGPSSENWERVGD